MPRPPRRSPSDPPPLRCTPLSALLPGWSALPERKAHELVLQAEALHDAIEPEATYPLDFVAFKLTGFRRDYGDASLLFGVPLAHDLRWIVDEVTLAHPMPLVADATKPVAAWAEELRVHPRTLRRWRDAGLRWRWVLAEGATTPMVAHTTAAVERFRRLHPERFSDAQAFSQLSDAQRRDATRRAGELSAARPERSLSDIAQQIADELGRAHETIRQLLLKQARRPDTPIAFPKPGQLLTPRQRRQTLRDRRRGDSLRVLGQRVGKSAPTLHRWLMDHRSAVLRRLRLEHVASPLFDRPDASDVYLRDALPEPSDQAARGHSELLAGLPVSVTGPLQHARRWDEGVRSSAFLRMNFCKHRAQAARDAALTAGELDAVEHDVRQAGRIRRALVQGELMALLSLIRRQATAGFDPGSAAFAALFQQGLAVLVEAIDTYNASGHNRFETYLRNRLQRALAPRVVALRDAPPTSDEARQRAVRRDAPTQADRAWAQVRRDLLRWVSDDGAGEGSAQR